MQPENFKETFCKLCLHPISNTNCQLIGEITKDFPEIVLPKLNLKERDKYFMCNSCSVKLSAALNFKSACMGTEDIIISYVNSSKTSVVDLKEIYLKEKGNVQLIDIRENQRICRLCFQLVTCGCVSLNEVDVDIINTYIQVDISATRDPVICGPCFDSLHSHGSFLKNCIDAQEYKHIDKQFNIKIEETEIKLEDGQDALEKYENIDKQSYIPFERVDIKVEDDYWHGESSSYGFDEKIDNEKMHVCEDVGEVKSERVLKCETGFNDTYKSEKPIFQNCAPALDTPLYRCDECTYETKRKPNLIRHQLKHKNPSEVRMYKCDTCTYESKYKGDINKHQLIHRNTSEIQMYKCSICTYEAKCKNYLKMHELVHKDSSEIQMYKCDTCTYESKYKHGLELHLLTHKDPSEIRMHKCNTCNYETKRKSHLKVHQLLHKDPSEIHMYKCHSCTYETKYKGSLKDHQLKHKNPSKIQMYKCDRCPYEAKYKKNLRNHQLTHENSSST
ncbi:zinc finger protein 99-like [Anoplophora glabripennis]|uniref:zinc finger protein 99-like n=1 Tax=Anoplophora glabripennis TaxID=217634 RepID=UPI00087507D1|nr:zinc finger protein 99-like [Anoplophora glabripennis]